MHQKKAVIIGSGIAGLAAAIRLAVQGFAVTVYEKNAGPGGKLSAFELNGFKFDAGPSLFTQPANIEELFTLCGEQMADYFSYESVPIACKYFFANGKTVNAYTDANEFSAELENKLDEKPGSVESYLGNAENLYNKIGTLFLEHSLHKRSTWLNSRTLKALKVLKPAYLLKSLHRYNTSKFKTPETVQLFNRFATYNGSNPYKAPAMLSVIPHLEQNQGTYFPKGGMISIVDALYRLAKRQGVVFHFNQPVSRIIHHEGKIKGIVVNQENVETNVVISNLDVFFTYRNLLNNLQSASDILKQERSSSAVIFYWGMNREFPEFGLHNILFSKQYEDEFDRIFHAKLPSADPTVYINISSKIQKDLAPAGKENWFVMVNAPANKGQDWQAIKENVRAAVIAKISHTLNIDIEPFIETEQSSDPVLIEEQTASYMGSLYGTSSNSRLAAFFRHPNFMSSISGLYCCGGSVHPGGGIPLCLKSAAITAALVAKDQKKRKRH